jgi:hypothetical protein
MAAAVEFARKFKVVEDAEDRLNDTHRRFSAVALIDSNKRNRGGRAGWWRDESPVDSLTIHNMCYRTLQVWRKMRLGLMASLIALTIASAD